MDLNFLRGGGVMASMLRDLDPRSSALGAPEDWPLSLRNLVSVMLSTPQPMFLAWGEQRRMLYNDAYIEVLGGHHPALGKPFLEVWSEIVDQVGPIMASAYRGESTYMDDISLVLQRHGRPEEAHFAFFYTPIYSETGTISGVLCGCTETTLRVAAQRDRSAELERLRVMFEQSPSAVAVLRGPAHRIELANAAFTALAGHGLVAGTPAAEALPEFTGQGFFELLDQAYASGQSLRRDAMALSVRSQPGDAAAVRYLDFIFQPLKPSAGTVAGLFVQGIDVTGAHEQASVLRQSEEKFRTFAQAMPNHVWTGPADGQLDWFNDQTLAYSGKAMEDLGGVRWVQQVHPDDVEQAAEAWARSLATGTNYETEFRIRRADGAYRWHLVRALPIRDAEGTVVRWVGTNTDIEEQRADREALRRLNAELEQRVVERTRERERIWRNSPDLMAVMKLDGTVAEVNPAWERILGWQPGGVVGMHMDTLVHADDLPSAHEALARATLGVLPTFECRIRHTDGSYRDIAWTAAPEGDAVFAFGRDISQAKAQRLALLAAEEQLRQAQKMEAIGQLTGGIAHDFNNMLASISGSIQLMQRRLRAGRTEQLGELLDRAAASSQRAAALTQRLLAFARRQALDIRCVDVVVLIESLRDMLERALGPKITLTLLPAAGLWPARIDGAQLESAVLNLAINARDAMPDGGRLTIAIENVVLDADDAASHPEVEAGDYVALRVGDDGVGMPASVIARAIEPFFTTKPIGQGTGLGLSMVYGFVRQAGGHLRIRSEPGRGTTVSLFLPRDASGSLQAEAPTAAPAAPAAGGGGTILVVEDEPDVRAVVVAVLDDMGYHHIEAADAQAALAIVDSGVGIDLLVTDVGLPGMNGRQLAEIVTARRPGLRVLFVTGYAEQAAARQGLFGNGMAMISKPFGVDELSARIRAMLAAGQTGQAPSRV